MVMLAFSRRIPTYRAASKFSIEPRKYNRECFDYLAHDPEEAVVYNIGYFSYYDETTYIAVSAIEASFDGAAHISVNE
jgi:hypothetical protein